VGIGHSSKHHLASVAYPQSGGLRLWQVKSIKLGRSALDFGVKASVSTTGDNGKILSNLLKPGCSIVSCNLQKGSLNFRESRKLQIW
jgi:hypothetical protein